MSGAEVVLFFSKSGDSFEVTDRDKGLQIDSLFLQKSSECKTHELVLEFLRELKGKPELLGQVELYHEHFRRYPLHSLNIGFGMQKGCNHEDTIERLIEFVETRIWEKKTPHYYFDQLDEMTRSVYDKLYEAARRTPFIGIIPAALISVLGLAEVVGGIALSILFCLPAFVFDHAGIIAERSFGHIGSGLFHFVLGFWEMLPPEEHYRKA